MGELAECHMFYIRGLSIKIKPLFQRIEESCTLSLQGLKENRISDFIYTAFVSG
jgi:hypothetical protein